MLKKYNCKLLKLHCVISAQEFYKLKVYKRLDNKLFGCAMINNNNFKGKIIVPLKLIFCYLIVEGVALSK